MIAPADITRIVDENRDEAIQCLKEVLQTPSVTGDELAVSKVFTRWIESCGLSVECSSKVPGRPNLVAEWHGTQPGKRFIFNGHMDVFAPPEGETPLHEPWSADIEDGYIYARGVSDMKSGDCAALMAVKLLRRLGFDPKGSVVLSYMCDEENGGWLGVKHMVEQGLLQGDFGICMEPTYGKILNRHWGILRMKVSYTAKPQHAGRPHPSVDALEKAVAAINRLYALDRELNQKVNQDGDCPCLSITVLRAGNTPNVQPGLAEFIIDRRLDFTETLEEGLAQILNILDELKAADSEYDYRYEILSDRPPLSIPEDDPFIQLARRSYEQMLGRPAELFHFSGGSDAATLRAAYGYSMPNYGPGISYGEYGGGGLNERCELEAYFDCIKSYMMIVVNALS